MRVHDETPNWDAQIGNEIRSVPVALMESSTQSFHIMNSNEALLRDVHVLLLRFLCCDAHALTLPSSSKMAIALEEPMEHLTTSTTAEREDVEKAVRAAVDALWFEFDEDEKPFSPPKLVPLLSAIFEKYDDQDDEMPPKTQRCGRLRERFGRRGAAALERAKEAYTAAAAGRAAAAEKAVEEAAEKEAAEKAASEGEVAEKAAEGAAEKAAEVAAAVDAERADELRERYSRMSVEELGSALRTLGLMSIGTKPVLIGRLVEMAGAAATEPATATEPDAAEAVATEKAASLYENSMPLYEDEEALVSPPPRKPIDLIEELFSAIFAPLAAKMAEMTSTLLAAQMAGMTAERTSTSDEQTAPSAAGAECAGDTASPSSEHQSSTVTSSTVTALCTVLLSGWVELSLQTVASQPLSQPCRHSHQVQALAFPKVPETPAFASIMLDPIVSGKETFDACRMLFDAPLRIGTRSGALQPKKITDWGPSPEPSDGMPRQDDIGIASQQARDFEVSGEPSMPLLGMPEQVETTEQTYELEVSPNVRPGMKLKLSIPGRVEKAVITVPAGAAPGRILSVPMLSKQEVAQVKLHDNGGDGLEDLAAAVTAAAAAVTAVTAVTAAAVTAVTAAAVTAALPAVVAPGSPEGIKSTRHNKWHGQRRECTATGGLRKLYRRVSPGDIFHIPLHMRPDDQELRVDASSAEERATRLARARAHKRSRPYLDTGLTD